MYEKLRSSVNWEGDAPSGLVMHACGLDENGELRVADVWNSVEDMENFFKNRLMPEYSKTNTTAPTVNIYPLHNLNILEALKGQGGA
jgi:hypothetical protein